MQELPKRAGFIRACRLFGGENHFEIESSRLPIPSAQRKLIVRNYYVDALQRKGGAHNFVA
jgi:hypothetical protein